MNDLIEKEQNEVVRPTEREDGWSFVKNHFLEVLRRVGIEPTKYEFEDFENRLISGLWNKVKRERMDERLIVKNAVDSIPIMLPNGRVGEQYRIEIDFSVDYKGFNNLPKDLQDKILDYKLMIYICEGTASEKLDWFEVVNVAGEELTQQELRNSVYTGAWLSDAKRHFSKSYGWSITERKSNN